MNSTPESFEFCGNTDVRYEGRYIGRVERDGRLALIDGYRTAEIATAVFEALHKQLHIGGEYEPAYGWPLEYYVADSDRQTNT